MNRSFRRLLVVAAISAVTLVVGALPASAATVVASWKMNEAAGATRMLDSSGNGLTGTISSRVKVGQAGKSGLAYGFTGNGGKVTVPTSSLFGHGTKPYDISLSFKSSTRPPASVADYDLIRKGLSTTGGGDWKIEVSQNGHAFCHMRGSSHSIDLTGTSNVVNGAWHRLTCRTDSTGTSLRVDGSVQARTASLPGAIDNAASVTIGTNSSGLDSTIGVIDEVVIAKS